MFQQILLDIHEARKQVEDLKEIGASSEDDMKKLKESVVERAECAANKLDNVHDYLMLAFDNKMEIVLHKAQVSLNNSFCILKFCFLQVLNHKLFGGHRSLADSACLHFS